MRGARLWGALAVGALALAGCGRSGPPPGDHAVTIAWQVNHEKGVNAARGGYRVVIGGRAPVDVPFPSPTTLTTVLYTGSYAVSVEAYQPDPEGSGTSWSAPATLTVVVP